jgi:hypothetical protein
MSDTKFLKEDIAAEAQDDAVLNPDMDLFKKRTHKATKFAHTKGFANKSFARKRKRVQ